jgi:hypothetical protein
MPESYVPPQFEEDAFHCPHCEAYANQKWQPISWSRGRGKYSPYNAKISNCTMCDEHTFWVNEKLIHPPESPAPLPNDDMPEEVENEYIQARNVVAQSPKAAAALLRLSMEKLTQNLTGNEDESLYNNIGQLLDNERIDDRIQQALDSVRVTGNDYVHAGEIYPDDDPETALRLFQLVNMIVEMTISRENLIDEAYSEIPENKLEGIQQRDGN